MKKFGALVIFLVAGRVGAAPPELALRVGGETTVHVFDDQPAQFELQVEAPLGTSVSVRADVAQVASGIAAPLVSGVKIADPVEFKDRTSTMVPARIAVPEVKRKTELRVRLRVGRAGEEASLSREARVMVYPRGLPESLKKPAGEIYLFGESARLRAFFSANKIPFTDAGKEMPGEFKKSALYLGETNEAIPPAPGARVVVFASWVELFPGVYRDRSPAGSVTKVTLPILGDLSDNPRSREIFSRILDQTSNP